MTFRKTYLLIAFITVSLSSYSQSWDDYFKWTTADSLHIYPSSTEKGKEINLKLIQEAGLDTVYSGTKYYANEYFKWNDSAYAFIIRYEDGWKDQPSVILVIANKQSKILDHLLIASYNTLEGAFEETFNSWIYDIDHDGDLDIVMMKDLVDFELPTEAEPNISKVEGYIQRNENGQFNYEYISQDLYQKLKVLK